MSERERRPLTRRLRDRGLKASDLAPGKLDELAATVAAGAVEPETVDPLPGSRHPRQPTLWPPEAKTA